MALERWVLEALLDVGISDPDPAEPLHVAIVNAVQRLGAGAPRGEILTAIRWQINWAQRQAGREFAAAKADYDRLFARTVVSEIAQASARGEKMAVSLAERVAEVACYEAKLKFLIAEKREQSLRKMLDTVEAQVDVWRTGRADSRAADRAHASGFSGGA